MNTPALVRLAIRWNARQVVEALYLGLLGRRPDAQGLETYTAALARDGDIASVARSIAGSEEAWSKTVVGHPAPLIAAAFRGLLGRDPEAEAVKTYSEYLDGHHDLAAILQDIGGSEEHWRRLLAVHAKAVVRAAFLALLKREPEPEALAVYIQELRQTGDVTALLSVIADSAEHWEVLLQGRRHSGRVLQSDDLPALLAEVVNSPKVWNELAELRFPQAGEARDAYCQDAWVFIHAQKTGGTSLQNMLAGAFGDKTFYREKGDTLYRRSPAELAQFSVFAGHFNYNSIAFIPRRNRHLFTFVREPRQRLLSLYRFLRAHKPDSPGFEGSKEIANRLDAVEFFRSVMAHAGSALWNHLTWCLMGQRRWNEYRQMLFGLDQAGVARQLKDIRVEIRDRLQEFAFIGVQEDYAHSCRRLFELIGRHLPQVRRDHSVEQLSVDARYFQYVPQRPLTLQLEEALAPLVQLDDIVYLESCEFYTRRWGRIADRVEYRSV